MGKRRKDGKRQASKRSEKPEVTACHVDMNDPLQHLKAVRDFAKMPAIEKLDIREPSQVVDWLQEWAKDNGFELLDRTPELLAMLPQCNQLPQCVIGLASDMQMSAREKSANVLQYMLAEPSTIEAMVFLAKHLQILSLEGLATADPMLCYFFACSGDNFLHRHSSFKKSEFQNMLQPLLKHWECPVCLDALDEVKGTVTPWDCSHMVCTRCFNSEDLESTNCPYCREKPVEGKFWRRVLTPQCD